MIIKLKSGDAAWKTLHGGTHEPLRSFAQIGKTSFIVGGYGLLLASPDGETWKKQELPLEDWLSDIWGDAQGLFMVGEKGLVLSSSDGGATWARLKLKTKEYLVAVWGAGGVGDEIHVAGNNGMLARTADRGKTWKTWSSGMSLLSAVWGLAADNVFAVGDSILRSTDRGVTWNPVSIPKLKSDAFFTDICGQGNDVYAVGRDGLVAASHDAGASWSVLKAPTKEHLNGVALTPAGELIAVGTYGALIQSDDQGKNWTVEKYEAPKETLSSEHLNQVGFNSKGIVYVLGDDMTVLTKKPRGAWVVQRKKSMVWMQAVWGEPSAKRIYAAGWDGRVLCTEDQGLNWSALETGTHALLRAIWGTPDGAHLFAVGDYAIAHSSNCGEKWSCQKIETTLCGLWGDVGPSGAPRRVFAISVGGTLFTSLDAGKSWEKSSLETHLAGLKGKRPGCIHGIWGEPGGAVFVVGDKGLILRSTDDGATWTRITSGTDETLLAIAGAGKDIYVVGYHGVILHSTDGGKTWDSTKENSLEFLAVAGTSAGVFQIAGNRGKIYRYEPGDTWRKQKSDNTNHVHGIWCSEAGDFYAVGDN